VQVLGAYPLNDSTWGSRLEKQLNASTIIAYRTKKGKYTLVINYTLYKSDEFEYHCERDPGNGVCEDARIEAIRLTKRGKWGPGEVRPDH
jgi:hypothetical protein